MDTVVAPNSWASIVGDAGPGLRASNAKEVLEISVTLEDEIPLMIKVEFPQAIVYGFSQKAKPEKEWRAKKVADEASEGKGDENNEIKSLEKVDLDTEFDGDETSIPEKKQQMLDEEIVEEISQTQDPSVKVVEGEKSAVTTSDIAIGKKVVEGKESSLAANPFNILYDLGGVTPLSVEAFLPLKADIRRVSERVRKKGSPSKK
ncbi:hypothetical protein LINPERPRIM_LOCUS11287 [Linum perenne]